MSDRNLDEDTTRKNYTKPYGGKHPIPTIREYKQHRKELAERYGGADDAQHVPEDDSRTRRAYASAKTILKGEDESRSKHEPYPVSNHNDQSRPGQADVDNSPSHVSGGRNASQERKNNKQDDKSATEQAAGAIDPRQKRKVMKHAKRAGGREVTDPVTHLPIVIHDKTTKDLHSVPENEPDPGSQPRTSTGLTGANKSRSELASEQRELQQRYNGLQKTFPPPSFKDVERDLAVLYKLALSTGLSTILFLAAGTVAASLLVYSTNSSLYLKAIIFAITLTLMLGLGSLIVYAIRGWLDKKVEEVWEDQTWQALHQEQEPHLNANSELPESVQWLNSLLASVWPLVNPDLFASLVDTLEDVMQASLPKVVRMVSIDDIGQGSEAIRILGINWLPTGAASKSVDEKGNLRTPAKNEQNDRTASGEGQQDQSVDDGEAEGQEHEPKQTIQEKKQQEQEQQAIRAGMEAEEGDFVNMELAFAYRARSSGRSIKSKAKNAHLYLKFYLPGGIAVPVWVELRGIMGIMRLRLQLTPDPPFFSICTFTFLGQPKADLSCVPLSKHSLNVMDVPLISSFVQSAIDAALAEYVAPKSMTLDLKDMLMGEDYKKDTSTRGVVWIFIKQARDFKQGDGGIGPVQGASDSYISVSWGKFGKPVASTRIIVDDQAPNWHEWASILVSPDEVNATEKLKLQLWDSDKWTADDDLGRVEVDLRELMHSSDTKNKMCEREDRFKGADLEKNMPGTLSWAVGYFEKTRITDMQLQKQTYNEKIRTKEELKRYVSDLSQRKLREAKLDTEHDDELHQQKVQDYKELEDSMIISAPPSPDHRSGILSIQIHNITGLEIQEFQKQDKGDQALESEDEQGTDLPDSYCTIILNHREIYKTRTKPKNARPFFNAGTERFVKDWTTTEIIVSVRDSREKEDDALLGVVYLPLRKLFEHRSQVIDTYPLAGGVGFGRARISMLWRSVELQLPAHLRGWDYGTLEIKGPVRPKGQLRASLEHDRIKIRTNLSRIKMQPRNGQWESKSRHNEGSVFLAVRSRYASPLLIEFRKSTVGPDKTPAFAVLWLSDLVDDEEETRTIKVWRGGKRTLQKAQTCCDYQGLDGADQGLGELELTLRFWRGLSGYHKSHATESKNADVRNVMECLDTINDEDMDDIYSDDDDSSTCDGNDPDIVTEGERMTHKAKGSSQDQPKSHDEESSEDGQTRKKLRTHTNQYEDPSDNSDQESNESSGFAKVKAPFTEVQSTMSSVADKLTGDHDIQDNGSRGLRAQVQDYKQNRRQLHRKHRGIMQWKSVRSLDWVGGKAKNTTGRIGQLFKHNEKDQGVETEV